MSHSRLLALRRVSPTGAQAGSAYLSDGDGLGAIGDGGGLRAVGRDHIDDLGDVGHVVVGRNGGSESEDGSGELHFDSVFFLSFRVLDDVLVEYVFFLPSKVSRGCAWTLEFDSNE